MIKVEILTDTTIDGLRVQLYDWGSNGWHLHEGIVITAREAVWGVNAQGQTVVETEACGFLQVITRTEGTCKVPQRPNENA